MTKFAIAFPGQGSQSLGMLSELAAQTSLDYPTASVAVRRLAQLASAG